MNDASVRSVYLVCSTAWQMFALITAILVSPQFYGEGYWWTAFLLVIFCGGDYGISKRIDGWECIDTTGRSK